MKKQHSLQRLRDKGYLYLKRNSSTILACVSSIGVIGTSVSSAIATRRAIRKLSKARKEKMEDLTKFEAFVIAAPSYLPSVALGASTIVCIFCSVSLDRKHQAALTSAYAMLNESYKDYRNKLIELHGEEADEEIMSAIVREHCSFHQIGVDSPDGKFLFYEEFSGETIECYEREIMDAEYHLNRNFTLRGYASLNEFYDFLGLPRTDYGEELGWTAADGYGWIDIEHHLVSSDDGGTPVYEIVYIFQPDADYMSDWE